MTIDSVDGAVEQMYGIAWRRCADGPTQPGWQQRMGDQMTHFRNRRDRPEWPQGWEHHPGGPRHRGGGGNPGAPTVPKPTGLAVSADSQTQLTVTWNSGGDTTAGYWMAWSGTTTPPVCTGGARLNNVNRYSRNDLAPDSTYSVTICAYDAQGNVSPGVSATQRTQASNRSVPMPTGISSTADSQTQLSIYWQSGGGSTAGFYIAFASGTVPPLCTGGLKIGNTNVYRRSDLAPGWTFTMTVCAYDSQGNVSPGISTTQTTLASNRAVPAPSGMTATADARNQLTMNWQSGGGSTAGFYIAFGPGSAPPLCTGGLQIGNVTHFTRAGLDPHSVFTMTVCAYDDQGNVSEGVSVTQRTR